ncbi:cobalt-precorrin 5A hydrolase [Clostridium tyrobutyricum]|uniref:cobalt-precorrin 5A hydrolase n=1 Tax=Clostridium tyrobutyricum TaxID=1519 RepID=UPI001C37F383|nr:cobalt-precorrin 5A hydrolase [Clostridium tyrobutyricum]MBV4418203.1 cobalt-precorrin 5A hydrolase [Clostridium tyrobutyricum]
MKIGIVSVTDSGDMIAEKLKKYYDAHIYSKKAVKDFNLKNISEYVMHNYKAIVFISSTGIAVRAISDFIKSKDIDPAVVVIDSSGKFVISLLSGHLGGANELTREIACKINAIPVITTATDNIGVTAPDLLAKKYNLIIDSLKSAKDISALLVNREKVGFKDERNIIQCPKGYIEKSHDQRGIVIITHRNEISGIDNRIKLLKLIRKDIVLGIGCRKNFPPKIMKDTILSVLKSENIDSRAVAAVSTVDIKQYEPAIIYLKDYFKCALSIFTREKIRMVQHKFQGSDFVEKTIGVKSVCQPCTYLSGVEQLTDKLKLNGMTLCIGVLKSVV